MLALLTAAVACRLALVWRIPTPWFADEFLYAVHAREWPPRWSEVFGDLATLQFHAYSTLVAPAWLASAMNVTYGLAKAINVALMTLAAVPVYLWARRLVRPLLALVAAALTLMLPAQLYSGLLLTENAFFPAFLFALCAVAFALERPTVRRQLLAIGVVALPMVFRAQGLVLFAIFPLSILMFAAFEARSAGSARSFVDAVRSFWPSIAIIGVLPVLYVAPKLATGEAGEFLGAYAGVAKERYEWGDVVHWVYVHAAELSLVLGVAPLAAFLLLVALMLGKRYAATRAERAFVAVGLTASLLLLLQVSAYSSRFSLRIEERNLFYIQPLFLLALVVWLARGAPRPVAATAVALVGAVAVLVGLPTDSQTVYGFSHLSEATGMVALGQLAGNLPGRLADAEAAAALVGFVGALAFAAVPRRVVAVVVPAALAGYLALSTLSVLGAQRDYAFGLANGAGISGEKRWIDEKVGSDARVVAVFAGDPEPGRFTSNFLLTYFWNRSVESILKLSPLAICCVPQADVAADSASGRITMPEAAAASPHADYAVVNGGTRIAGRRLGGQNQLVLFRLANPLRVSSSVEGVYADGWIGHTAAYNHFWTPNGRPGMAKIVVSRRAWGGPDVPGAVTIRAGPLVAPDGSPSIGRLTVRRRWTIHSGASRVFLIPAPRPPFRVEITISPTFSPSLFGHADSRQLGAQVDFRAW